MHTVTFKRKTHHLNDAQMRQMPQYTMAYDGCEIRRRLDVTVGQMQRTGLENSRESDGVAWEN